MSKSVLAAQLYTVREFAKTPSEIANTLKKVKEIGYDSVQVSGIGPIEPKELKRIIDNEGLSICATHTSYERMVKDIQSVIEGHHLWNCKYVGIGGMPEQYRNKEGFYKFAKESSIIAKKLLENGLIFFYHNHSFELEKFEGKTGLEILFNESDPETFNFCIDTYWIQHGGGDPAAWIKKFNTRVPLIHLKDMVMVGGNQLMAEVGEGNLNWKSILKACKNAGVKWYIVEQDICQRDPFESLSISFKNLNKMGIK